MVKATLIVEVTHQNGDRATAKPRRPNSTLFEILDGPHVGKRGADTDLFDLAGLLEWDPDRFSIFETGELVDATTFNERSKMIWEGRCSP
jgi:hypothetical protein